MPWGSVKVDGPAGRRVYVNGNYGETAGVTGDMFPVEYGRNRFETLDPAYRVDFATEVIVNDANPDIRADLAPVIPPRPTTLTPPADLPGDNQ